MDIPKKQTNKRSANSLINGISFQYAAAILIFIKEMKNVRAVGIEDTEDIRILLKDNTNIYAQAKSSLEPDPLYNNSHLSTDIKKSMETLYENKDNDANKLISIFNYHNPFGEQPTFNDTRHMVKTYTDLTSVLKEKIKNFCNNDQEMLNKLEFWFLRFEDSSDHYSDLISEVEKYIKKIDSSNIYTSDLVNTWRALMENNGSNKKKLVDFNIIIGSIFSHILVNSIRFDDVYDIISSDEIDFLGIEKMSKIFNEKLRNLVSFEEYANVLGVFSKFRQENPTLLRNKNLLYKEFANFHVTVVDDNIIKMFEDDDMPETLALLFSKSLSVAYAMKSDVIRKVKEVFEYEN